MAAVAAGWRIVAVDLAAVAVGLRIVVVDLAASADFVGVGFASGFALNVASVDFVVAKASVTVAGVDCVVPVDAVAAGIAVADAAVAVVVLTSAVDAAAACVEETSDNSETAARLKTADCRLTADPPSSRTPEIHPLAGETVQTGTVDYPCFLPGRN